MCMSLHTLHPIRALHGCVPEAAMLLCTVMFCYLVPFITDSCLYCTVLWSIIMLHLLQICEDICIVVDTSKASLLALSNVGQRILTQTQPYLHLIIIPKELVHAVKKIHSVYL